MDPLHLSSETELEASIQNKIIKYLEDRCWTVMPTHGNAAQKGFPDLYCTHHMYGQRWVEVKNPNSYSFTKAQCEFFPKINKAGIGIWVLIAANGTEYRKLFEKGEHKCGNWTEYYFRWRNLGSRNKQHLAVKREK